MLDLFTPIVPDEAQHPNFRFLADAALSKPEQAALMCWAQDFEDRDGKFVHEFQTSFNSSFWELYLHAAFRDLGCCADYRFHAPDFVLKSPHGRLLAGAVVASHASGHAPEWERRLDRESIGSLKPEEVLTLASIRISNAIAAKVDKYAKSYSKLAHVPGQPYVICVAPFEQPFFFLQNDNALRRVLYGFDQPLFIDPTESERMMLGEARIPDVQKENGAVIPLGLFTRPGLEEVSAVIFSNTATYTKLRAFAGEGSYPVVMVACRYNREALTHRVIQLPRPAYTETLLDGLHVCLNPFARHPLPMGIFHGREVAIHTFDPTNGEYLVDAPDGFLIQHGCISVAPEGQATRHHRVLAPPGTYKQFALPPFADGQLVPFEGDVMVFTDHHLAHHRGWTIMVCRDSVDDDWSAQAIKGICHTLASFHRADKSEDHLVLGSWHKEKVPAYRAMRNRVDCELDPAKKKKLRAKELKKALRGRGMRAGRKRK